MKNSILAGLVAVLAIACAEKPQEKPMYTLFVGTYTDGDSEGIYTYSFNANTGELSNQKLAAKLTNPSYLAISEDAVT